MIGLSDLIQEFREAADDTEAQPRTSDAMVLRLLGWAVRESGKRMPVEDTTSSFCMIPVVAATRHYKLSPLILSIETVKANNGAELSKTTLERLRTATHSRTGVFLNDDWRTWSGTPTSYLEDAQPGWLTLVPYPVVPGFLYLKVYRTFEFNVGLDELKDPDFELPGIPDHYREALLYGMLYRAFSRPDRDEFEDKLANVYLDQFEQQVGPAVTPQQLEARRFNANLSVFLTPRRIERL